MYSFTCTGQETSLLHCDSALWNVIGICSHDNDAGVTCHNNGIIIGVILCKIIPYHY